MKAEKLNKALHIEDKQFVIQKHHVVQCHTPLSSPAFLERYQDKYIIISGTDESLNAAISYGYKKAIHVDELTAVYPTAVPPDIHL